MKRILSLLLAVALTAVLLTPAASAVQPFSDVDPAAWYAWSVADTRARDLLKGTGNNTFSPEAPLTRAMLVTILWRLAGQPPYKTPIPFRDVSQVQWYSYAVGWASEHIVTVGLSTDRFGPDEPVTREQAAVLFYRWARGQGYDLSFVPNDLPGWEARGGQTVSSWATEAVEWADSHFFLNRRPVTGQGVLASAWYLCAGETATRGEIAAFLSRFCRTFLDGGDEAKVTLTPGEEPFLSLTVPEAWQGSFRITEADYAGVEGARSLTLQELSNTFPRSSMGRLCTLTLWPAGVDSAWFGDLEKLGDAAPGRSGRLCTLETAAGEWDLYVTYPDESQGAVYDHEHPKHYERMAGAVEEVLGSIRFPAGVSVVDTAEGYDFAG